MTGTFCLVQTRSQSRRKVMSPRSWLVVLVDERNLIPRLVCRYCVTSGCFSTGDATLWKATRNSQGRRPHKARYIHASPMCLYLFTAFRCFGTYTTNASRESSPMMAALPALGICADPARLTGPQKLFCVRLTAGKHVVRGDMSCDVYISQYSFVLDSVR